MKPNKTSLLTYVMIIITCITAAGLLARGGGGHFGGHGEHGGHGGWGHGDRFGAGLVTGAVLGSALTWQGGTYNGRYYEPGELCSDDNGATWYPCSSN